MKIKQIHALFYLLLSFGLLSVSNDIVASPRAKNTDFTTTELSAIQGHFSTIYGYMYIRANGKKVGTKFDNKYFQLIKKTDGHFYPQYKLLRFIPISLGEMSFQLVEKSSKTQIFMFQPNKKTHVVAQKFQPIAIPPVWKKRLGNYKAIVKKGQSNIRKIRLTIKNGILVAYINKLTNPYPLLALSDTEIYSPSAGHNQDQAISIQAFPKELQLRYGKNHLILQKL